MQRRNFIKKVGLATAGAFVAPYILPGGRLFAATAGPKAGHVVFCILGGGVRNQETIHMSEGNLMPNTLAGTKPVSSDIISSMDALSKLTDLPLQNYGTLYKSFKYKEGAINHSCAIKAALTGVYTAPESEIKDRPDGPTIFEYYNKHKSQSGNRNNSWLITNRPGAFANIDYSNNSNYGSPFGPNVIQPLSAGFTGTANLKGQSGFQQLNIPLTGDLANACVAEKIIKENKPELLVVDMNDADICHSDYTAYCNSIQKSDYALAQLWNTIQNTPGMANDTVMIVAPEIGRNEYSNAIIDENGRAALDHNDDSARDTFCLVLGPPSFIKQNTTITQSSGETINIAATIADVLGIYDSIPHSFRDKMGTSLIHALV